MASSQPEAQHGRDDDRSDHQRRLARRQREGSRPDTMDEEADHSLVISVPPPRSLYP